MTRTHLSAWGACEDTLDAASLVVSELVTNAIVHTASRRIHCELRELRDDAGDRLRIAVRDEGCIPGDARAGRVAPEEEHGRGLLLVAAVATAWGAQETGPGLLVWAELPRDDDRAPRSAGPVPGASDGAGWAW